MLIDIVKNLFNHWLLTELNQTDIVKEEIEKI